MSREWTIYVRDMVACCDRILTYTEGVSRDVFDERGLVFDGTVRNLELLGEAANQLSEEVRARASEIEWRKLIDLRNILIHTRRHHALGDESARVPRHYSGQQIGRFQYRRPAAARSQA